MPLTGNGKGSASTTLTTQSTATQAQNLTFIRRGRLIDGPQIGRVAALTYSNSPLTSLLAPLRFKYWADYERAFVQRSIARLLSSRSVTWVACPIDEPGTVVGYGQFVRLGDDVGARNVVREVGALNRIVMFVLGWLFWVYCKVFNWAVGGDKSANKEKLKKFQDAATMGKEKVWDSRDERGNRWHSQSVVVLEKWQGQGIGKRLMKEVIQRAQNEGVPVGLEASRPGEMMYRSMGFELLSRFDDEADKLEGGSSGGFMMWSPDGWKERFGGES